MMRPHHEAQIGYSKRPGLGLLCSNISPNKKGDAKPTQDCQSATAGHSQGTSTQIGTANNLGNEVETSYSALSPGLFDHPSQPLNVI